MAEEQVVSIRLEHDTSLDQRERQAKRRQPYVSYVRIQAGQHVGESWPMCGTCLRSFGLKFDSPSMRIVQRRRKAVRARAAWILFGLGAMLAAVFPATWSIGAAIVFGLAAIYLTLHWRRYQGVLRIGYWKGHRVSVR